MSLYGVGTFPKLNDLEIAALELRKPTENEAEISMRISDFSLAFSTCNFRAFLEI